MKACTEKTLTFMSRIQSPQKLQRHEEQGRTEDLESNRSELGKLRRGDEERT